MFRTSVFFIFTIFNVNGFPKVEDEHSYKLYTREDWGAIPTSETKLIQTPVPYVIIHHTYLPAACDTPDKCMAAMRSMQNYHISQDWQDIGYNFCIGSEGGAYEGRGWDRVGIHAGSANNFSIGVCLIGDWMENEPPVKMLETTQALIKDGVRAGVVSPTYKLMGHRQAMATQCPGDRLYAIISKDLEWATREWKACVKKEGIGKFQVNCQFT